MCGLCGSFTQQGVDLSKRDRAVRARTLEGLLIANQVRGTDSAGVAAINYEGDYSLLKRSVEPAKFVRGPESQALLRKSAPLMIGHTRMTSMGNDVTDENAHPFVEGNVIGAHNGVINNYMELDATVNVDSQAVFRLIDSQPDDLEYVFKRVWGSCALTWWDARDAEALYVIAHSNPLSMAIVPKIKTLFWSSVSDHLETVMWASYGSMPQFIDIKQDTVYRFDANDIWEWSEQPVSFAHYKSPYTSSNVRVYSGAGWYDDEWEHYGIRTPNGTSAGPKALVESKGASNATDPMSKEEEARYEEFWNRLMDEDEAANLPSESESDYNGSKIANVVSRIHDQSELQFNTNRFEVDDVDGTLECGYCDKPMGQGGVWDDGLQMMLCRYCQKWWDEYGHYSASNQPNKKTSTSLAVYNGGHA